MAEECHNVIKIKRKWAHRLTKAEESSRRKFDIKAIISLGYCWNGIVYGMGEKFYTFSIKIFFECHEMRSRWKIPKEPEMENWIYV
jgi:hypothetical protein